LREEEMSEGRASAIFQALIFGLSSIGILILTWTRPMPGMERVLSTFIGATGILVSAIKVCHFRMAKESLVEVEAKDKI
jgi:hypothetical protein